MAVDVDPAPTESAGNTPTEARRWQDSWLAAALGERGYWWRHRVADGFRTAAATSPSYAAALLGVLDSVQHGQPRITRVIDIGAGDGDLIDAVAVARPNLRCLGVDVRPRPGTTGVSGPGPGRSGWLVDRWQPGADSWIGGALAGELAHRQPTMIICSEWLDEIPLPLLDVDETQQLIGLDSTEQAWRERWWPSSGRVEVGTTRDRAWAWLIEALQDAGGVAVMIDYGHLQHDRPILGSLRAFADGRVVTPIPDGRANLSCAVAVDAVQAAGERRGARTVGLLTQREAMHRFSATPAVGPAARRAGDSAEPLVELARRSATEVLSSGRGFGAYWWLIQQVTGAATADV